MKKIMATIYENCEAEVKCFDITHCLYHIRALAEIAAKIHSNPEGFCNATMMMVHLIREIERGVNLNLDEPIVNDAKNKFEPAGS